MGFKRGESRRAIFAEASSKFNAGRLTYNWSETIALFKSAGMADGRLFTAVKTSRIRAARLPCLPGWSGDSRPGRQASFSREELATPPRRGLGDGFQKRYAATINKA